MKPFYVRELTVYPTGKRRIWLLSIAVLASLIANFETTLSTILPLLLTDLNMSLQVYGLISAVSVLVGGLSAGFGGILSDRWGRTAILVPTLTLTAACNFLLATVDSATGLFWVRCLMLFIEGAAISITASLVRDFSPRMGRAQAFAFWTWGSIGAAFLASAIAGLTLPLFGNTWQSQAIIMGCVSLVLCAVVIWQIAEPSAALRNQVIAEEDVVTAEEKLDSGKVRALLKHPHLWAHVLGNTAWNVLYWTLTLFSAAILVTAFGLTIGEANLVAALGIVLNALTVVAVGRVSDRLQLRKPFIMVGTIGTIAVLAYYITMIGDAAGFGHIAAVYAGLYLFMGIAYVPWMASFSEDAEDVDPSLQGAALGLWGLAVRVMIVMLLLAATQVAATYGWAAWLLVALAGQVLFLLAALTFKGAWRSPRP